MSRLYFACSRLWIYDFGSDVDDSKSYVARLKKIRYIERGHTRAALSASRPAAKSFRRFVTSRKEEQSEKGELRSLNRFFAQILPFSESFGKRSI